ncbi:hypothetical protein [Kocuria rosea]|uniref:hypothetical protein n=1 Tax=Kocuria rosea TaxID=1275 RepID=UPI0011A3603A|nr:hypothetical protein [Kocuria rosea]
MAPRKSATKTEARERARRAAAESMAREQRLLEMGEEFFIAQGEAEQITETAEQRITEIRAKAEQEAAQAKEALASVVVHMKGERVTVSDIAQRLELSATEVRALLKEPAANTPADAATVSGDNDDVAPALDDAEASRRETVSV